MRYAAEDYFDVLFDDFRIRRNVLDAAGVEPGQAPMMWLGSKDPFPTPNVACQFPFMPSRSAFDLGGRKTVADLIADTPLTTQKLRDLGRG